MATTVSSTMSSSIPKLWDNAWRLDQQEHEDAKALLRTSEWTTTDIVKTYLDAKIEEFEEDRRHSEASLSLTDLTIDTIVNSLEACSDVDEQIKTIAEALEWPMYKRLLLSGRVPYLYLRKFFEHCPDEKGLDFDLGILQLTRYIRSSPTAPNIPKMFIKAEDLLLTLGADLRRKRSPNGDYAVFKRERRPDNVFGIYDRYWEPTLKVFLSRESMEESLDDLTFELFEDLDWSNMVLVGDVPYSAIHQTNSKDSNTPTPLRVEFRLYDLDAVEASRKVDNLVNILRHGTFDWTISKRVGATLMGYDNLEHIIIKHHIYQSKYDAIAACPLDARSIGFDGEHILMTPGCARALEQGYSTFSPEVLFKEHIFTHSDDLGRQNTVFAAVGMGIRFLPALVHSLESPQSTVSGIEIVQRAACYARDWAQQHSYIGAMIDLEFDPVDGYYDIPSFSVWKESIDDKKEFPYAPAADYVLFKSWHDRPEYPTAATGFASLQTTARDHELWRVARAPVSFDPFYLHNPDAHALFDYALRPAIEERIGRPTTRGEYVDYLTRRIRHMVQDSEYKHVGRKQIVFPLLIARGLEAYLAERWDAELEADDPRRFRNLLIPVHDPVSYAQLPVRALPSLSESDSEHEGNIRYLVVSNSIRWRGKSRLRDQIFDILCSLAQYFVELALSNSRPVADPEPGESAFNASCFRLRWRLCVDLRREATASKARGVCPSRQSRSGLSGDEIDLFRAWVHSDPDLPSLTAPDFIPEPLPEIRYG